MSNAHEFGDVILNRIRFTEGVISIGSNPEHSGSGGGNSGPPKPPKAPTKPNKKPKK